MSSYFKLTASLTTHHKMMPGNKSLESTDIIKGHSSEVVQKVTTSLLASQCVYNEMLACKG